MAEIKELNLVCMSGQGSVQAGEALAKLHAQDGAFVAVNVYPGTRARSAPVINYLKVSDSPGLASCANYKPTEVIVFQEELLLTAKENTHELVADAIGRLKKGLLLVNSPKPPEEIDLPYALEGVVATVDATEIAQRLLGRNPPPVGLTLLGAYSRITESIKLDELAEVIRETFPGTVGERNVQAAQEAYDQVQVTGVRFKADRTPAHLQRANVEDLPQYYRFDRFDELPGYRKGSPFVWRDKIPICEDTKCTCVGSCISEIVCPDGTGFIVRKDMPHQGYRIDLDFCRGCGLCAQVCVGSALTMVDEDQVRRGNPNYVNINVEPHIEEVASRQRFRKSSNPQAADEQE